MEDNIFDKIEEVDLKKKMEESYIDYAMSVIAASLTTTVSGICCVPMLSFYYK